MKNRIASLDGLRAISICLVILGHAYGTHGYPTNRFTSFVHPLAHFGVQIFFVISGFLITSLLLKERASTGHVNLLAFYRRRTFRILPAATAYIATVVLLWAAIGRGFPTRFVLAACTYTMNYLHSTPWQLSHLWSLAVEEQFYLVWPILFTLFYRARKLTCLAVMILAPLARHAEVLGLETPIHADLLAPGCLLALFPAFRLPQWMYSLAFTLFACGSTVAMAIFMLDRNVLTWGIVPCLVALCLHILVQREDRFLNSRLIVYLGGLSYALYLCQQPFLNKHSSHWYAAFPQNIVLSVIAALVMHYAIEKPVLALGHRSVKKKKESRTLVAA